MKTAGKMTTTILKTITPADLDALHSVYIAVHRAHKAAPKLFTPLNCTTAVTALMSFNAWAWRVVGITPAALQMYKEHDFKRKSNQGITRAHLRRRIDTVKELLAPEEPMTAVSFIQTLLRHDATILCAKGENRDPAPKYIAFTNDDASMFASLKISFNYGKREEALLRELSSRSCHSLVQPEGAGTPYAIRETKGETTAMAQSKRSTRPSEAPDFMWGAKFIEGKGEFDRANVTFEGEELAERRATRHGVKVLGEVYSSLWQAWKALSLPTRDAISFRKNLKLQGRLIYEFNGTSYLFEIVA